MLPSLTCQGWPGPDDRLSNTLDNEEHMDNLAEVPLFDQRSCIYESHKLAKCTQNHRQNDSTYMREVTTSDANLKHARKQPAMTLCDSHSRIHVSISKLVHRPSHLYIQCKPTPHSVQPAGGKPKEYKTKRDSKARLGNNQSCSHIIHAPVQHAQGSKEATCTTQRRSAVYLIMIYANNIDLSYCYIKGGTKHTSGECASQCIRPCPYRQSTRPPHQSPLPWRPAGTPQSVAAHPIHPRTSKGGLPIPLQTLQPKITIAVPLGMGAPHTAITEATAGYSMHRHACGKAWSLL